LKKIGLARSRIDQHVASGGQAILLEVDGGVKTNNIRAIAAAGADTFVAGSAIFGQPDYRQVIDAMRAELAQSQKEG
jgi:ribulose-phosphate 3-epimerase